MLIAVPAKNEAKMTQEFLVSARSLKGSNRIGLWDNGSDPSLDSLLLPGESYVKAGILTIYEMWNEMLAWSVAEQEPVMICNNDILFSSRNVCTRLEKSLDQNSGVGLISPGFDLRLFPREKLYSVRPHVSGAGGPAGFCFVVPPHVAAQFKFDTQFKWWFGDVDYFRVLSEAGYKLAVDNRVKIRHFESSTAKKLDLSRIMKEDEAKFFAKW